MVIEFDCWAFIVCRDHSRLLRVNSDELQAKKDRLVELQTTCKMTQYVTYVYSTLRWQWCIAPDAEYDAINHVFFQRVLRGPRSSSIAWSQVWLGLFAGRFQSGGTCRIHAARAQWWSSRGELQAIWPDACLDPINCAGTSTRPDCQAS